MNEIKVHVVKQADRKNLAMRYIDPITGKPVKRSAGTHLRREAERAAAKWEAELREGRYAADSRMAWEDFIELYDEQKLSSLADSSAKNVYKVVNQITRLCAPRRLCDVTTQMISDFQHKLRLQGLRDTTIASYFEELQAMMNWAKNQGLIGQAPRIDKPKRAKGITRIMRGRPIILEEFERMISAVPKVRKLDTPLWERLLLGLWLSGLRLGEALILSWNEDAPLCVYLRGKYPKLRFYASAHKAHRDQLLPITPDFAEFLLSTPEGERRGLVFRIYARDGISPGTVDRGTRIVSAIGKAAGIVTNKAEGQHATAHDLRRAFGTRWSKRVMPATLKVLMRHRDISTTMKYYVDRDADDIAEELWNQLGSIPGSSDDKRPCFSGDFA